MEILFLLIPLSVVLALLIGGAFWWSVRSGQFDDLDGPAHRIVADDDTPPRPGPPHHGDSGSSEDAHVQARVPGHLTSVNVPHRPRT